jgi:hypothetical protein
MNNRYFALIIVLGFTSPLFSMWQQVSGQKEEKTSCTVHFESTATILCDKPDNYTIKRYLEHPDHPFIREGVKPYQLGNGGLLNPKLLEYNCVAQPIVSEGKVMESVYPLGFSRGVQITVKGIVETEGIAPLALNAKVYGQNFNNDSTVKHYHETGLLEDVILGALKERSVDRGISDMGDHFFTGGEFLQKYIEIIKAEWTSHLGDDDVDGTRSPEQNDMIKRHFPRKAYWPSTWYAEKYRRCGRQRSMELSSYGCNLKDAAKFKVILDTFKIDVQRVGEKDMDEVLAEMVKEINVKKIADRDIDQGK